MTRDQLLTFEDVVAVTKLTKSPMYQFIKSGDFPKPIKLGAALRWSKLDIQECQTNQSRIMVR